MSNTQRMQKLYNPKPHSCHTCGKRDVMYHCPRCGAMHGYDYGFIAPDESDWTWHQTKKGELPKVENAKSVINKDR